MRKNIYSLLLLCTIPLLGWSQEIIIPNKNIVDKKWIKNQSYQMIWSVLKDTISLTVAIVNTKVDVLRDRVQVITEVKLKGAASPWIDSTIVRKADLSPVYHASYNAQRNMALNFGEKVKGFYYNKKTGDTNKIEQQLEPGYFDSNFYPMLINWLPLKNDFKADINIYDYNPNGKTGIIKAHILGVTEGKYLSAKLGERKVWIVEVSDEISNAADGKIIYQIDQLTRQLYKQKIYAGGRVMEMTLIENE